MHPATTGIIARGSAHKAGRDRNGQKIVYAQRLALPSCARSDAPRPTPHAPRPTPHALHPMPYTPCPMPYTPCIMPYTPCIMPYALRPTPHTPLPTPHASRHTLFCCRASATFLPQQSIALAPSTSDTPPVLLLCHSRAGVYEISIGHLRCTPGTATAPAQNHL